LFYYVDLAWFFSDRSQNAKLADWGGMQQLTEESPATGLFPAKGAFSYRCRKTQQLVRVKIGKMGEIAVLSSIFVFFAVPECLCFG